MTVRRRLGGTLTGFSKGALSGIGMMRQQELLEALRGQGTDELKSVGDLIPATNVERLNLPSLQPTPGLEDPAVDQNLLRLLRELDLFSGR